MTRPHDARAHWTTKLSPRDKPHPWRWAGEGDDASGIKGRENALDTDLQAAPAHRRLRLPKGDRLRVQPRGLGQVALPPAEKRPPGPDLCARRWTTALDHGPRIRAGASLWSQNRPDAGFGIGVEAADGLKSWFDEMLKSH